ncbi:unnamed protein product, partial [Scytosiphon promiscuus]
LLPLATRLSACPNDALATPSPWSGVPLVYELDENLKVIPHKDGIAPLQGRYLGD